MLFGAAHTYIAYIGECHPPPPKCLYYIWFKIAYLNTAIESKPSSIVQRSITSLKGNLINGSDIPIPVLNRATVTSIYIKLFFIKSLVDKGLQ